MIKRWIIPILSVIFFYSSSSYCAEPLLSQEKLFKQITTSINREPHLWFSTGSNLVYAESRDDVKMLKDKMYPNHSDAAKVVVSFNFGSPETRTNDYIKIAKPFETGFLKGKVYDSLMIQIKIFVYNELKKEVSRFAKVPEPKKTDPLPKKAPENKDDPEKL